MITFESLQEISAHGIPNNEFVIKVEALSHLQSSYVLLLFCQGNTFFKFILCACFNAYLDKQVHSLICISSEICMCINCSASPKYYEVENLQL